MSHKKMEVVIALIRDNEGKIFLQQRHNPEFPDAHGKWEFPGGGIEPGESIEAAIQRECLEEMGCHVHLIRLLPHIQHNHWKHMDGSTIDTDVRCYEAVIHYGVPQVVDKEVS